MKIELFKNDEPFEAQESQQIRTAFEMHYLGADFHKLVKSLRKALLRKQQAGERFDGMA